MSVLLVHKRPFHAFLSHAHANNIVVDSLYSWLNEKADIPIWYDGHALPASATINTYLPEIIVECRAMIIILSEASIKSGWVQQEYKAAIGQRNRFRDFRFIPVRIEKCEVPEFLRTIRRIDILDGRLDLKTANQLLTGLYYDNIASIRGKTRDVYVSHTWRTSEACLADYVCQQLDKARFRLIGDSPDQAHFEDGKRVESIISSCGGLVAILPNRGRGKTSKYILKEIQFAQALSLPYLVVKEPGVELPENLAESAINIVVNDVQNGFPDKTVLQESIELLMEAWKRPIQPHHIFFGTTLDTRHKQRNKTIQQVIQNVTAMPCIMGEEIREGQIQEVITRQILQAFALIADISEDNLNTCIEAGIARGANIRYHLVAQEPRRRPPFMFRDQQVWHYNNDVELLGKIHRIVFPYRRRILNWELPK